MNPPGPRVFLRPSGSYLGARETLTKLELSFRAKWHCPFCGQCPESRNLLFSFPQPNQILPKFGTAGCAASANRFLPNQKISNSKTAATGTKN